MAVFDDGIQATELGHPGTGEAEVLLVGGSGPTGASMSLVRARCGIQNVNITNYRWPRTRRPHVTDQRTVKFFGDMQVLAGGEQLATPLPLKKPEIRSDK